MLKEYTHVVFVGDVEILYEMSLSDFYTIMGNNLCANGITFVKNDMININNILYAYETKEETTEFV